jgi:hypothetical protein
MVGRTLGFLIVRRVLGFLGLGRSPDAKDIEIAVLRYQIGVLNRQVAREDDMLRRPAAVVGAQARRVLELMTCGASPVGAQDGLRSAR